MKGARRAAMTIGIVLAVAPLARRAAADGWVAGRTRETPVRVAPTSAAPRRGTLRADTPARALGERPGHGCPSWLRLEAAGYVCADDVRAAPPPDAAAPSADGPPSIAAPPSTDEPPPADALLPQPQAFVAFDATPAYARPGDQRLGRVAESLGEGFSLVVVGRVVSDGVAFVETRRGLYVEEAAVRFARPSAFAGVRVEGGAGGALPAFALRDGAPVHARPGGRVTGRLPWRAAVGTTGEARRGWVALVGGGWVRDRDVARARPPGASPDAPPADVGDDERWIEVDLAEQVVVARVGRRLRFATIASTGRPGHETPTGTFRVWAKLEASNMSDLEDTEVARNYALEAVPWVLYFAEGVGFHAAFWHDDFGRPRSHGCVNLAPRDARWLFGFARPSLPRGWSAILPTEDDPGTRVWVHR